jgi:hypothetical protein
LSDERLFPIDCVIAKAAVEEWESPVCINGHNYSPQSIVRALNYGRPFSFSEAELEQIPEQLFYIWDFALLCDLGECFAPKSVDLVVWLMICLGEQEFPLSTNPSACQTWGHFMSKRRSLEASLFETVFPAISEECRKSWHPLSLSKVLIVRFIKTIFEEYRERLKPERQDNDDCALSLGKLIKNPPLLSDINAILGNASSSLFTKSA